MDDERVTVENGRISILHLGYKIVFDESEETWSCHELSIRGKTLKAAKEAVSKVDRASRRVDNVKVLVLEGGYYAGATTTNARFSPGEVTMLVEGEPGMAWVTYSKGNRGSERRKLRIASLTLDTPETRQKLKDLQAEFDRLSALAKEVGKQVDALCTMEDKDFMTEAAASVRIRERPKG